MHPLSYLSKTPGIGGSIKSVPEDFIVEEICNDGTVLSSDTSPTKPDEPGGRFVHFILQKRDWSTASAISEIAKRLGTNHRHLSFAGNKDKTAVTTQLVSVMGVPKERLLALNIKDISVNGAWTAKDKVRLGQLLGNRFTITVRDAGRGGDAASIAETVSSIASELGGRFPNYFGEQRFGSTRRNTCDVGIAIVRGNLEEAVRIFLCDSGNEQNEQARLAREELKASGEYGRALNYFPRHLRLERMLLGHLQKKPGDYTGALLALPRPTLLMFVHAVQSRIFNGLLSERLAERLSEGRDGCGIEPERGEYFCGEALGFPDTGKAEAEGWVVGKLIGYDSPLNERERAMLEKLGIEKDQFRIRQLPDIASRGTYRTLFAPLRDFNFSADSCTFRFSLPAGSYATVAMREFMDGSKKKAARGE